jgi:hypothetical protein
LSSAEGRGSRRGFWKVLAGLGLAAKRVESRGWESLDFLGFSRQNRAFSMGYGRLSAEILCAPLPSRWADLSRFRRAVRFAGHAVLPVRPQIFSPQSGRGRSPVPNLSIMRPPRISGKRMSVILIYGFPATGWRRFGARRSAPVTGDGCALARAARRRAPPNLARQRHRCDAPDRRRHAVEVQETSLGGLAANFVEC